jgi:tripartite ATP-independent transporter DctP family solute receptor
MLSRRLAVRFGLTGLGSSATPAAGHASGASPVVLKAADAHPLGYPSVVALEHMGAKLADATGDRLTLRLYPSMQLGGEKEEIEQAQLGALAIARVSVGPLGDVVNDLNVLNLPFLFRDTAHAWRVMDGPIGRELLDRVSDHPTANLIGLCWFDAGAHGLYNSRRPIRRMEDLKGLKIRVMGNPVFVDMINAMGGNGVAMGYDQVVAALRTGVVDGAENSPTGYVFDHHYEAAKYFTLTEHLIVPAIVVFSKPIWATLSNDDRGLLLDLARAARLENHILWDRYETAAFEKMAEAGIVTDKIADRPSLQEAVKPIWERYGPGFKDMIARIQAVP